MIFYKFVADRWLLSSVKSAWKGSNAGGPKSNDLSSYSCNPQYRLSLLEAGLTSEKNVFLSNFENLKMILMKMKMTNHQLVNAVLLLV